jgi:serine/threonine protein kinase
MGLSCKGKSSITVCNTTEAQSAKKCSNLQVFKFKDLEAATGGFANENLIVKASHGLIFRGTLKDGRVVAVKRPATGARLWHDEDAFENEMQVLSKLFSRRLVNLLGHSQDGKVKLLVVEHMVNGSLHDHLHGTIDRASCLSWPMRVQLALQVAKAIRALHASTPPIIHRNIRSMNVFIDRDWNARLGDFGLARCAQESEPPRKSSNLSSIPEVDTEEGAARFSVGLDDFVDLEHENPSHISTKTDVFNFGMLLLEIMSGRSAVSLDADFTPFSLLDWALPLIKHGNAMAICDSRLKPPQVTATVKQMATIAARCVRASGSRRPSMDDIVHGLTNVSKLLPLPMWSGLTGLGTRVRTTLRHGPENLFPTNCHTDPALCKASRFIRLPLWTGFLRLKKRKRALIFGLGKILARKLRISTVRYTRIPSNPKATKKEPRRSCSKGGPIGASRVSDEGVREQRQLAKTLHVVEHPYPIVQQSEDKPDSLGAAGFRKSGYPHWTSGKYSARVVQMGNVHERAAVRGL